MELYKLEEFIKDAYIHAKFIGYSNDLEPILKKLNLKIDKGMGLFKNAKDVSKFLSLCRNLRFWERQQNHI